MSEQQDSQSLPDYRLPDDLIVSGIREAAAPGNWGMEACKIADLRAVGGDGEGEVVAVLDTGASPEHPEFAGRWHATPMSFVPGESYVDNHGHATHCLGSAAGSTPGIGVAFKAKLLAGKCLSNQGSGLDQWIYNSVKWAFDSGATVISLSIGGGGYSAQMDALFKQVTAAGCVIVAATGNERQQGGQTTYPGRYESALAVAAVDSNGKYAGFSNPGQTPDTLAFAAPGVGIWSAMPGGGYQQMSGSSMATPFGGGVIAAYQSARVKAGLRRFTTTDFRTLFRGYAIDAGATGIDRDYGAGLISGASLARTLVQVPEVK